VDHVGAGGWAYFRIPGADPLEAYARAFSCVEVNSTFYRHPTRRQVAEWRRRVPAEFTFSVKCHSAVTHREGLAPTRACLDAFARSLAVAHALRSPLLVLETPATLRFTGSRVRDMTALLASADRRGIAIALEARAHATGALPPELERALRDLAVADCTDYSRQPPRVASEVAVTRLFGKGEHNRWVFSDEELRTVEAVARHADADRVFFTFHGIRMYRDAARFATFKRTGRFPVEAGGGQERLRLEELPPLTEPLAIM
jgi:uncharacterized protein YecE (DUF72 family)